MASSRLSPGPHDRKTPRTQCIKLTRQGQRCKRPAVGSSKLCRTHKMLAESALPADYDEEQDETTVGQRGGPIPEPADLVRGSLSTNLRREARRRKAALDKAKAEGRQPTHVPRGAGYGGRKSQTLLPSNSTVAATLVVTEQSRDALRRLGQPVDSRLDPKIVLLDTVHSAWEQRKIWEQMLRAIPDEDWDHIGKTPIPGVLSSSKGARIETIQRFLADATKIAARTSKLAIDAGIEERLVRIAEEQSALIADTVRAGIIAGISMLARQGIISPQAEAQAIEAAIGSAATHLRQLAAGQDLDGSGPGTIYEGIAQEVG